MSLPNLASTKDLKRLLPAGASWAKAHLLLEKASNRFRGEVRRPISLVENDELTLDGDGTRVLLLPSAPVVNVTSVLVDGEQVTDYEWSATGVLRRKAGWPDRLNAITVTYTHGFDPVPQDIQTVVLEQAQHSFYATPGVSSTQVGGISIATGGAALAGLSEHWATTVEKYRLNRGETA